MSISPVGYSRVTYHLKRVDKYIEDYFKLFKWKKNSKIMDIGTGPGHLLLRIEPSFPKDYAEILCVDKSKKMVQFFNALEKDERIKAIQMDIQTPNLPNELKGRFDFLFSCNSIMYWFDIRQAFMNISQLLNKNGQLFFIWPKVGHIHGIYKKLSGTQKWAPYLNEFSKWSNYFDTKNTTSTVEAEFKRVGIEVIKSEVSATSYADKDKKNLIGVFDSMDFVSERIPKIDLHDYKEDFHKLVHAELVVEKSYDKKTIWILPYDNIIVAARKT